jgi:hypothetical protein
MSSAQVNRWRDFRRRVEYSPSSVYRHRVHAWEYIPVHPFGDDVQELARLGLRPDDCRSADVWWGVDGDATLLSCTATPGSEKPSYFAKVAPNAPRVYLDAVVNAPYVTREHVEAAMSVFHTAGFPRAATFALRNVGAGIEIRAR